MSISPTSRPGWTGAPPDDAPISAILTASPDAQRWWDRTQPVRDRLASVPERLARVLAAMRDAINAAEVSEDLTRKGKLDRRAAAQSTALQAIDAIFQSAQEDAQQLEALIDQATAQQAPDPQAALLFESQVSRAWNRTARLLDVTLDNNALLNIIDQIAQDAAQAQDKAASVALREELPAYLKARRLGGVADGILRRLDELEIPFLPATARAARLLELQAREGWQRIAAAVQMARNEASEQAGRTVLLPGYFSNESINF